MCSVPRSSETLLPMRSRQKGPMSWGMVMGVTGKDVRESRVGEMPAGKDSGSTAGPEFQL